MKIYLLAFLILGAVLLAHIVGLEGWYFSYFWYDTMMHLLGGVGIGLFTSALLSSYAFGRFLSRRNIVLGVIGVGLIWECFEIYFQLTGHPLWTKWYYIDTVKDLVNDTVGGTIVAWLVTRQRSGDRPI